MGDLFSPKMSKPKPLPKPKVVRKPTQEDVTELALNRRKKYAGRGGRASTVLSASADNASSDGQKLG